MENETSCLNHDKLISTTIKAFLEKYNLKIKSGFICNDLGLGIYEVDEDSNNTLRFLEGYDSAMEYILLKKIRENKEHYKEVNK